MSLATTTSASQRESGVRNLGTFSTLRVESQHQSSQGALAVFFSEHWNGQTISTIPPTVMAYRMVSNDAEVFKLIRDDDLDGLLRRLACGHASIRDCDERSRSLLHVSALAKTDVNLLTRVVRVLKRQPQVLFVLSWSWC